MSSNPVWFKWTGIDELIAQFATLAPDLTTTAAPSVEAAAQTAKDTIYAGYPTRTGNLKDHLAVVLTGESTRTKATVINTSPHAVLFETLDLLPHTAPSA